MGGVQLKLNLTTTPADDLRAGVIDLPAAAREQLALLLDFGSLGGLGDQRARASAIADLAAMHATGEDRTDEDGLLPSGDTGLFAFSVVVDSAVMPSSFLPLLRGALADHGLQMSDVQAAAR